MFSCTVRCGSSACMARAHRLYRPAPHSIISGLRYQGDALSGLWVSVVYTATASVPKAMVR